MPRRRLSKSKAASGAIPNRTSKNQKLNPIDFRRKPSPESDESDKDSRGVPVHEEQGSASEHEETSDSEDDQDADAPRIAVWEDETEPPNDGTFDDDTVAAVASVGPSKSQLTTLQDDLSSLPLGALLKARRALEQAHADSDSELDANSDVESEGTSEELGPTKEKKPEWSTKPRTDLEKRANKHAPTEVTSKRPVTRRRTVVDVKKPVVRDPRFLPVTGELLTPTLQQNYSFLVDLHKTELGTLREHLKRARKLLTSSPRDLRAEREEEVNRLELAVKRAESLVNRDRREAVERAALDKVEREEKEKRKEGKGRFWMKEGAKRELLIRARYEALAAAGGRSAVRKAIEKKQKKVHQKEKKSRPYAPALSGDGGKGRKRMSDGGQGEQGSRKRQRV